jgi:hypothetical protein
MIDPEAKSPAPQPRGQLVEAPARAASSPLDHHRGAERLYEAIGAACQAAADFAEQLRSALAAALALLAAEPDLARLLCLEPYLRGDELLESQRVWQARLAALLRQAARASPRAATHPPFLEPLLIGGICWQLSAFVQAGQAEQLDQLLPGLLESLLAYYLGPEERVRILAELRSAGR